VLGAAVRPPLSSVLGSSDEYYLFVYLFFMNLQNIHPLNVLKNYTYAAICFKWWWALAPIHGNYSGAIVVPIVVSKQS
jgi:hypothetical protein